MSVKRFFVEQLPRQRRFLALVILAITAFFIHGSFESYEDTEKQEIARLRHQAHVIEQNISSRLHSVGVAIKDIRDVVPYWFSAPDGLERAEFRLKGMAKALPGVLAMLVLDANGVVVVSSREGIPPGASLADRDYFQVHLKGPAA